MITGHITVTEIVIKWLPVNDLITDYHIVFEMFTFLLNQLPIINAITK